MTECALSSTAAARSILSVFPSLERRRSSRRRDLDDGLAPPVVQVPPRHVVGVRRERRGGRGRVRPRPGEVLLPEGKASVFRVRFTRYLPPRPPPCRCTASYQKQVGEAAEIRGHDLGGQPQFLRRGRRNLPSGGPLADADGE